MKALKVLLTYCVIVGVSDAAKILAVFPFPAYSHFIIGDVLTRELASKGHEITVVSPFPPKEEVPNNYKFIELKGVKEYMEKQTKGINFFEDQDINTFLMPFIMSGFGYEMANFFYENENIQTLLKSKETYDVIIVEHFFSESTYGLCYLFKAPCIALSAMGSSNWSNRLTGNIGLASYIPQPLTTYAPKMSFIERLHNLALLTFEELVFHLYVIPKLNKLVHQHIPQAPHIYELMHNVSMVFLNSHPALSSPVSLPPNTKELAGIHVEGIKNVKLPSDLQKFLDDHNEGVVYFALGSNAKSKDMPKGKLQEILKALKRWGKPILWKYEEELPEKIGNVKIAKWFPQTAVLAHKNVIAFITHCGRLSSLESLYYGVPMIGLPLFAEQAHNSAEMDYYGYAVGLSFKSVNAENLYNALVEVTTNKKYTEEAKLRSKAMQKQNSLEEAIYWVEHVVEFKGASYLRNAGVDLPWYQLWMVDVIGFFMVSLMVFNVFVSYLVLRLLTRKSKNIKQKGKSNVTQHKKRV